MLYLIPFLHQTTTDMYSLCPLFRLYLIPFLHQTTTFHVVYYTLLELYLIPFLHQTTTSLKWSVSDIGLYLIPFLHQTTTPPFFKSFYISCILFHFYIKPQPFFRSIVYFIVVSYSISTSNHNPYRTASVSMTLYLIPFLHQTTTFHVVYYTLLELYLIPFLHQTTTSLKWSVSDIGLYLIPFLHQTTTPPFFKSFYISCILFHFYIKPQHINTSIACL